MILSQPTTKTLIDAIEVCNYFGIESMIMESDSVRGLTESHDIALIDKKINDIEGTIALNRLDTLTKRCKMIKDPIIEFIPGNCDYLKIKSNKLKIDYRCGNANLIKAPKDLGVSEICTIEFSEDLFQTLNKGKSAMAAEEISIIVDNDVVMYKMIDSNNDQFLLEDGTTDTETSLAYSYSIKAFLRALQKCDDNKFTICERGVLNFNISNFNVCILKLK